MKVYLLRHAEAEPHGGKSSDEARELTAGGKARLAEAARGLRRLGVDFDALLTSPLVRAVQTATIVAAAYDHRREPQTMLELATGVPPARVVAALAALTRHEQVMLVGHEPQLSGIVSLLLTGASDRLNVRFKKGGCVALEVPARGEHRPAALLWSLTQGQLRRLRK